MLLLCISATLMLWKHAIIIYSHEKCSIYSKSTLISVSFGLNLTLFCATDICFFGFFVCFGFVCFVSDLSLLYGSLCENNNRVTLFFVFTEVFWHWSTDLKILIPCISVIWDFRAFCGKILFFQWIEVKYPTENGCEELCRTAKHLPAFLCLLLPLLHSPRCRSTSCQAFSSPWLQPPVPLQLDC